MDYFNQVLFVEDDMDVNSIGVRQVRSMGYLVWPTYSVGEALECFTQHRDRIGILIGPYEAGPYAEGGYEVTLPVTPAILAVVKPEYRASFAASR